MKSSWIKHRVFAFAGLILFGCGINDDFAVPVSDCNGFGSPLISLAELKAYYQGETVRIPDFVQWEGYVVSSDATSNLFGEIYLQDEEGKTTVLKAAPEFEVLAENTIGDGFMASPAVSGDALYLRSRTHLYCIRK